MLKVVCIVLWIFIRVNDSSDTCTFSVFCDYGDDEEPVDGSQTCKNIQKRTFEELLLIKNAAYIRDLTVNNCLKDLKSEIFNNIVNLNELNLENNDIAEVSVNCFNMTTLVTLKMTNSKIKTIEGKLGNLPQLLRLVLNNNKLTDFSSEILSHPETLRYLNLQNNKLTILTYNMFNGLKNLNALNLAHNKINLIEADAFSDLARLNSITLTGNNIQTLTGNELPKCGFKYLRHLYIGSNRLMFLSPTFLSKLGTDVDIEIGGNPWHCRCLETMMEYLRTRKMSVSFCDELLIARPDTPYCIQPSDSCNYEYDLSIVHKYLNEMKTKQIINHKNCLVSILAFVRAG
ncbi:leucine-rich repeat-containing protein 15-like [Aethina tumida]|uniref:leucine-rich repeat-containing protein 15-like n=1 Tax=Aethina tumida TaxID=116153 RepID=UPI002148D847|nr:leucine-rich repeat-containing protein 15-like [Aethina tumida]